MGNAAAACDYLLNGTIYPAAIRGIRSTAFLFVLFVQAEAKNRGSRSGRRLVQKAAERNPETPDLPCLLGMIDYFRGELVDAEMEF